MTVNELKALYVEKRELALQFGGVWVSQALELEKQLNELENEVKPAVMEIDRNKNITSFGNKKVQELKAGDKLQVKQDRNTTYYVVVETVEKVSEKFVLINGQFKKKIGNDVATVLEVKKAL